MSFFFQEGGGSGEEGRGDFWFWDPGKRIDRGILGGGGFWTSRVTFNRISLIGQISVNRWWNLRDWNMHMLLCKSLNPCVCLRLRRWKVMHQSDNPLMLVPWLDSGEDGFFSPSISISSCAVYSHASHVIPASLSGSHLHIWPQYLSDLSHPAHVSLKLFLTMSALLYSTRSLNFQSND